MVLMISAIFLEERVIPPMAATASFTTAPPCSAPARAETANWFACLAFSAFCFTVEVISSSEEAVSSRLLACSWAPLLSSPLPAASCWTALRT